jgi:aryl-alcohol dehydrogenase-like predicted oxidoreductase
MDTHHLPTRRLGREGREVGSLGLGCVGMSAEYDPALIDDARSRRVLMRALDLGVSLFDTADSYGPHHNEVLLGEALRPYRHRAVIATKWGLVVDARTGAYRPDGRPERARPACEASLERLGMDSVDLYFLHRVDPSVPIEESWGAMARLVEDGLVQSIGLSEVDRPALERAHRVHPVAAVQSEFSLWTRDPLAEVLPWCEEHGAAFLPYAPLGRGFLTGAVESADFSADDIRAGNPRFSAEAIRRNQRILRVVDRIAREHTATPAQVSLAWLLAQGPWVVPIPGTKRVSHLEENCRAARLELPAAALAELDRLPPPHGDRY